MAWYECASSPAYLIDPSIIIDGVFIRYEDGVESSYPGWSATPYIRVYGGETLKMAIPAGWQKYNAWYDADKQFISNIQFSATGYLETTVPSNAYYIRLSEQTARMGYLMLWRDDGNLTRVGGLYSNELNIISTTYTVNS